MFKGLPNDKCSRPHWGYVFKGRLTFDCGDHEEVFEAGDAFHVEPRLRGVPSWLASGWIEPS